MAPPQKHSAGAADHAEVHLVAAAAADELSAFLRLSALASTGPTLADVRGTSRIAVDHLDRHERLADHLAGLGVDVEEALRPWRASLDTFHRRMAPSTWGEAVVGAYVGDAVAPDLWAALAAGAGPTTAALVRSVLGPRTPDAPSPGGPDGTAPHEPALHEPVPDAPDDPVAAFAVRSLARVVAADPQAAGRLSLWGRRLVGEALGQAQAVLTACPDLQGLLEGRTDPGPVARAPVTDAFARITRAHVVRMGRLGLTP